MTTVMLVEDNVTLLENIAFELEMREYDVLQASDGKFALQLLEQGQIPDIIVSDIAMPDMDGYALLDNVRTNNNWQNIPFIFLTAFDSKNAVRIGKDLGVDDYLVKPFDPEDLISAMRNKLKRIQQIENNAMHRLDETRRELLNMISHELRTPLTAVYGGSEMLADSLEDVSDEMTQHMLQLIRSGSKRLNDLVNRIVMMVQVDSGHMERLLKQSSHPTNFITVVMGAVASIQDDPNFAHANVTLNVTYDEQSMCVMGMHDFLNTAVMELLSNAVKFAKPNTQINVNTLVEGGHVVFRVTDEGRGIPAEHLDSVWQRFVQVDRDYYEQQGMGVGLALVHDIVTAHNGSASLASALDQGTTATIILPRLDSDDCV